MDDRAILTTKNTVVNSLNIQIVEAVPGQEHIFLTNVTQRVGLGLADMVEHDFRLHPAQVGQQIVLQASFCGSPRFMM
jgi:hypothetical protein